VSDQSSTDEAAAPVDTSPLANTIASMQEEDVPVRARQGTVDSVQQGSVSVKVGAAAQPTTGLRFLGDSPIVGDTVWLLEFGADKLVLGALGRPSVPPGTIVMFGSATPPAGWLLCNGQSTSGHPNLAAAVGANVPDLRNRFIVAAGSTYAQGNTGGEAAHVLTEAEMPSHTHPGDAHSHTAGAHTHAGFNHNHAVPDHTHPQNVSAAVGGGGVRTDYDEDAASSPFPQGINTGGSGTLTTGSDGGAYNTGSGGNVSTTSDGSGASTGARGGGQAAENRPPYYALTFVIRT
jgi:microcystin-dependent protein